MGSRCVPRYYRVNNSDTAPATVNCCINCSDESDTSLNTRAMLLIVHDVAEGYIGGNLYFVGLGPVHLFSAFPPSSLIQD